jgi:hypothetical protein
MRKLIAEATWTTIKKCPVFKSFFERLMGGKEDRKKIALVGAAHRLMRVMGAMLKSGEAYRGIEPSGSPPRKTPDA